MQNPLWLLVGGALILAALVVVCEFGFGLAARIGVNEANFRLELLKMIWQFLLLAVLGGAVGLFFKIREGAAAARRDAEYRELEQRATKRESLLRMRADLVTAYNEAKAIRRLLRSSALEEAGGQVVLRRDEYNSLMRRLIEPQLQFEYYAELVNSDQLLFPKPEDLRAELGAVEEYLNKVVGEFEDAWKIFDRSKQPLLDDFEILKEFVRRLEKGSPFEEKFKERFHKALRLIKSMADEVP